MQVAILCFINIESVAARDREKMRILSPSPFFKSGEIVLFQLGRNRTGYRPRCCGKSEGKSCRLLAARGETSPPNRGNVWYSPAHYRGDSHVLHTLGDQSEGLVSHGGFKSPRIGGQQPDRLFVRVTIRS